MSIFKTVSGQGPDVVVLHGWGCSHQHMQPVVDQLTNRYCVHNFDLPGRGQSSWNESIQSIADIADQLLPHLPERAIYIGWSFGGLVATAIASRFRERVSRIIGLSTLPKFIEAEGWPAVPSPGFYEPFSQGLASMSVSAFFKSYYENEFKSIQPKPECYDQLCALLPLYQDDDAEVLLKGVRICDKTDLRPEFQSLHCPIDMILGDQDQSVPAAVYPALQALKPDASLHIIEGAQHMAFWTHPEKFNPILAKLMV